MAMKLIVTRVLIWIVSLLALQAVCSCAINPGFRAIITQKGLDYGMLTEDNYNRAETVETAHLKI